MRNLFKSSLTQFDAAGMEKLRQTALLLVDETLCVIHANQHAESLFLLPTFRLEGAPVGQLFADANGVDGLLRQVRATHEQPGWSPPTYLLRKAQTRDEQRLWKVQVHVLPDDQLGKLLLLQVRGP